MPKNAVTDPITDQEMDFAHLVLSGTMNDRQAAEAAGLNPSTAAYTKSKPRVRDYMIEHRAAVSEKLIDQEAEALRSRNLARDQIRDRILDRLWQLAKIDPEVTRGSIAAQVKAMSMIVAIEGLIPNRRISTAHAQPAFPPVPPPIYDSEAMRRQPQAEGQEPDKSVTAVEVRPTTLSEPEPPAMSANDTPFVNKHHGHTSRGNPFTHPKQVDSAFTAMGLTFDAHIKTINSLRLPLASGKESMGGGR